MTDYIFIFVTVFAGVVTIATWVYKPGKPASALVPEPERIKDQLAWHKNVGTVWNG